MLLASSERPADGAAATGLWVPGMSPQAVDGGSARAREIARRQEELLGMLHDLPESEYELSLTDLVDKAGAAGGNSGSGSAAPPSERKEASPEPGPGRSASGRQAEQQQQTAARPERRGSARRRGDGWSSFRSSSDGVLLNFYMPRSLTRSFTAPRPGRTPSAVSGGRASSVSDDCNKRDRDGDTVKCWSLLWDRRWRKSSRRDPNAPLGESTLRAASAAVLKAAKHSAPPAKI